VHDILSGVFHMIDDSFRVGEYIQVGSDTGTVEGATLRNVRLRTDRGTLKIIPYSELKTVTNFMRGGLVEKISLDLPYGTDIDKVRKIIKKVGQKIQENPELGPDLMRPLKSQGVKSVSDSVMTFRAKFTARPGKHFMIRREAFKMLSAELARAGIEFARRQVIVNVAAAPPAEAPSAGTPPGPAAKPAPAGLDPGLAAMAGGAAAAQVMAQEAEAAEKAKAKETGGR
jgi:small-conductance mechanosensitive channel